VVDEVGAVVVDDEALEPDAHLLSESLMVDETPFQVFSGSDFRSLFRLVKSAIGI
jgi:hypothetical protein